MKNAEKLIQDVEKKLRNWNERSQFTIKGVKNLSRADLDSLVLYARTYIANGGSFSGLMSPMGSIKEVLDKYDLADKYAW